MAPEASRPALDLLFASHPRHGVAIDPDAPRQVTARVGETLAPILGKG